MTRLTDSRPITTPGKQYYFLKEVADAWNCTVPDLFHYAIHNGLRIGVRLYREILYGLNSQSRTVGVYSVDGVLSVPNICAEAWENGSQKPCVAGGFTVETDYPPEISEASYMAEDTLGPPVFTWAKERDWSNSDVNTAQIEFFTTSEDKLLSISRESIVIHAEERTRFESQVLARAAANAPEEKSLQEAPSQLPDCLDVPFLSLVDVAKYWARELRLDEYATLKPLCLAAYYWQTEKFKDAGRGSEDPKFLEVRAVTSDVVTSALHTIAIEGRCLDDELKQLLLSVAVDRQSFKDWCRRNNSRLPGFWFTSEPESEENSGTNRHYAAAEQAHLNSGERRKRTRMTNITRAIENARDRLLRSRGREPTGNEVFSFLEDGGDSIVVDSKSDILIWEDTNNKLHETRRKTVGNILSKLRNPV